MKKEFLITLIFAIAVSAMPSLAYEKYSPQNIDDKTNGLVNIYSNNNVNSKMSDPKKVINLQKQELKLEMQAIKKKKELIKQEKKALAAQQKNAKKSNSLNKKKSLINRNDEAKTKDKPSIGSSKSFTTKPLNAQSYKDYAALQQRFNVPRQVIKQQRQINAQMAEYGAQSIKSNQYQQQYQQMQNQKSINDIPITREDYKRMGSPALPSGASQYMRGGRSSAGYGF